MQEAATWHYFVAMFLFGLIGMVSHVVRAVFNILPDRLSDRPMMDMALSSGYDWKDRLFGTEYDENGYYRLDSLKNLRLAILFTVAGGMFTMVFSQGASTIFAHWIDAGIAAFGRLFLYRIETFTWW